MKLKIDNNYYELTRLSKIWKDKYNEYNRNDIIVLDNKKDIIDDLEISRPITIVEKYNNYNNMLNNIYNDVSQVCGFDSDGNVSNDFLMFGREIRDLDNLQLYQAKNENYEESIKLIKKAIIMLLDYYHKYMDEDKIDSNNIKR